MRRLIVIAALAVIAGAGGAYYLGWFGADHSRPAGNAAAARGGRAVPVVAGSATRKAMPVPFDAVGTVQAIESVAVRARVDSVIEQINFRAGDLVHAGDVLVTLDSRALQAQLRQSEANLARDQAQLAQNRRDQDRNDQLVQREVVSRTTVDQTRTAGAVLDATIRGDQAQIDNLRVLLGYYTIRSPITGRAGAINLTVGNTVKANDASSMIATINQVNPIYVAFPVPQRRLAELQAARAAGTLRISAAPAGAQPVLGRLAFLENAVDATSGTIMVRGEFPNEDERLVPGQTVNLVVTLRVDENAVVVPATAVQISQDGPFVFVIKPDRTVEMRRVRVARTVDGESVIAEGLDGTEQVVVDGQLRITVGSRVEPQAARPPAGAAPRGPVPEATLAPAPSPSRPTAERTPPREGA